MSLAQRSTAEFIGTYWLVLGACGGAVLSAAFPNVGIGLLGVAFAFGLTVLTMAYAIGHISDRHLSPAVSVGLAVGGWALGQLWLFWVAPIVGAALAGGSTPGWEANPTRASARARAARGGARSRA